MLSRIALAGLLLASLASCQTTTTVQQTEQKPAATFFADKRAARIARSIEDVRQYSKFCVEFLKTGSVRPNSISANYTIEKRKRGLSIQTTSTEPGLLGPVPQTYVTLTNEREGRSCTIQVFRIQRDEFHEFSKQLKASFESAGLNQNATGSGRWKADKGGRWFVLDQAR